MTLDECRAIYRTKYVGPFALVPEPLRSLLVDWAVTSGHDDPTRALQRALRARGVYVDPIDGLFGPKTRAAIVHDPQPRETYRDVFAARIRFYTMLGLNDPDVVDFVDKHPKTQLRNVVGWINRCLEFQL
jgi:lysozyme family protein